MNDTEVLEPEVDDQPGRALARPLRDPRVPVTVNDLSARKGEGIEIIEARALVLQTLRTASIRATSPEDWVLFKSPDGRITGYLQDCGADRVRDLYGIEIYNVSSPEKVAGTEPHVFHYLITGDGRCKITQQTVENIEGGRSSTDDFCRGKSGIDLALTVRKAARANLDGGITRELAGMKSVPIDELIAAWKGTDKKTDHCRLGRGFGGRAERQGAAMREAGQPQVEAPFCEVCGAKGSFVKAGKTAEGREYDAFWTCPKRDTHKDQKWTVTEVKWSETLKQRATEADSTNAREPGAEG